MPMNQHLSPLKAPLRGQQAAVPKPAAATMGPAGGFEAAAKARMGGQGYQDPSLRPAPAQSAGNALPAQHMKAQQQEGAGVPFGQQFTGTSGVAPQKSPAGAQAPAAAPAAPANMGGHDYFAERPAQNAAARQRSAFADAARARQIAGAIAGNMADRGVQGAFQALKQQQEKESAAKNAYAAADAGVKGAFEALGNSAKQPSAGMDWDPNAAGGQGAWVEGNPIDTGKEGIEENLIDAMMNKDVEDYLMPEEVRKQKEDELWRQTAMARRQLQQELGARGIGASGIAASELGGLDQGLQQAIGQMNSADWQQAVEQRQNELGMFLDAYGKTLSEENRIKIFEEMQKDEKQSDYWTAANNTASAVGADRWDPKSWAAYWKAVKNGADPADLQAFIDVQRVGDEMIALFNEETPPSPPVPDAVTGDTSYDETYVTEAAKGKSPPPEFMKAYKSEAEAQAIWDMMTLEERQAVINGAKYGKAN